MNRIANTLFFIALILGGCILAPVALVALACGMDIDAAANAASEEV